MALSEIRELAAEQSGRLDLSDERWNYYVNEGVKWLDGQQDHLTPTGRRSINLAVGVNEVMLTGCRTVEGVYRKVAGTGLVELEPLSIGEAIRDYPKQENSDRGSPFFWSFKALETTDPVGRCLLYVFPPPNVASEIVVYGQFKSKVLAANNDDNFWSVEHPQLLVLATLWAVETGNRNTEGLRDYEAAMYTYLNGIDKDLVSQQSAGVLVMRDWDYL